MLCRRGKVEIPEYLRAGLVAVVGSLAGLAAVVIVGIAICLRAVAGGLASRRR
jgi:hypothetical protein